MSKVFAAASFASLMGLVKPKGARAEGDDKKDDENAKGSRAEDDKDDKDDEGAKGSRADDGNGDDDGSTDARGAKADDEEDDDAASEDDGDEKKDAKGQKSAKAERQRCARIISHGIKCGRVEQAGVLAFDTGMSSKAAISVLNAAGAAEPSKSNASRAGNLRDRMNAEPEPNRVEGKQAAVGGGLADRIIAAGKKRRGEQ